MPRPPQKTTGAPFCYSYKFNLTDVQKKRLFDDLLGFDFDDKKDRKKAEQVIINIESYLGAYEGMVESADKEPTTAQYIAELNNLRNQSWALCQDLATTSHWMHNLIEAHGYDLHKSTRDVAQLFDMITKVLQSKENEELDSRGRPKKRALKMLINTINQNFEHYNRNNPQARNDFIKECLDIAGIESPKDISKLIYNESTPENERKYFRQI